MPIDLDHLAHLDDETDVGVTPGTNQAQALEFLYANTGLGFRPKEIRDETAIQNDSVYAVLGRLVDKGLVGRSAGGYYHALEDDEVATTVARSLHVRPDPTRASDTNDGDPSAAPADGGTGTNSPTPPVERRKSPSHTHDEAARGPTHQSDEAARGPTHQSDEAAGSTSLSPDDAFSLLGNDTRVAILQALWDAFESGTADNALPFSELFDRVDIRDSGNFSYHLEKLSGPFIRRTADGYELKQTGINVVRAVVVGTVAEDLTAGPTTIDVACPLCGAPVEMRYEDELLNICCTACEGRSEWRGRSGHLFGAFVPPASLEDRPADDAFRAAVRYSLHEVAAFHDGVCPDCSGSVERTVSVCYDHNLAGGLRCSNCTRYNMAVVRMVCETCKRSIPPPVALVVLDDPDVTAFSRERGIEYRFASWATVERSYRVGEKLRSREPLRMDFTVPAGGDVLGITLDGELDVIDISS